MIDAIKRMLFGPNVRCSSGVVVLSTSVELTPLITDVDEIVFSLGFANCLDIQDVHFVRVVRGDWTIEIPCNYILPPLPDCSGLDVDYGSVMKSCGYLDFSCLHIKTGVRSSTEAFRVELLGFDSKRYRGPFQGLPTFDHDPSKPSPRNRREAIFPDFIRNSTDTSFRVPDDIRFGHEYWLVLTDHKDWTRRRG